MAIPARRPVRRSTRRRALTAPRTGAAVVAAFALPVAGLLVAGLVGDPGAAAWTAGGLSAFLVMGAVAGFSVSGST